MAQIQTKFIADEAVISTKIGSQSATSQQALFADGGGGADFRSIISSDIPTLNQNTTGTAANITATSNSTLTTLSVLSLPGSQVTGNISGNAANVTGVVGLVNGGTGQVSAAAAFTALAPLTTAGQLIYENNTPAPAALNIGTTGQVLTVVAGLPAWATPSVSPGAIALTDNHILVGNGSNLAADVAMSGDATIVASGALTLATVNSNVGSFGSSTSIPSFTVNAKGLITAVSGNAVVAPAGTLSGTTLNSTVVSSSLTSLGAQTQALNMNSNQINNLANGTTSSDAINLGQLQAAIAGLYWQGPAEAYAASNIPLTGGATLTIDGYSVQNGDLVILGNQTVASQNGEYTVSGIGTAYTLTPNGLPTAAGDAWLILNGTVYADSAFVANAAVPAATFTEFAGPTAYTFNAPLSLSGRTVSITQATTSTNGYLSSTDWNTFNNKQAAGNYITALTGDGTASGPGSAAFTLATVNSNVGSFGSSTSIPNFTVNAKGLITAAGSNAVVAPAGTLSGTTLNSTVVSSSLTSVGTIGTGVWQGTAVAIGYGGTGQATAQAGFDALSPLTTAGDTIYYNGSHNTRLAIGSTGQILTVVSGEPAWASPAATSTATEDVLTLNSTDITNQYKDLNYAAIGSSSSVNSIELGVYGGPEQLKGTDYTVSLTGGAGGVTRITFAGDLATGGNAALVSGDILMVSYTH